MNKGFTLIELLAVIVILAVIALIATPIILNIIEDTKEQSVKSSANLYVDGLVKQIASRNMINEFNPSSCTITNGNVTCDGQALEYNVNGDKPTSGSITLNNGIVTGYTLAISGYTVTKNQNGVSATKGSTPANPVYTLGALVQYNPVNNSACTTGETCYKWRVITPNDNASNANITLQMDHNIVNVVEWISSYDLNGTDRYSTYSGATSKGPVTVLKALEEETTLWDNSLKLNYTYDTSAAANNYGILSCTNGTCTVAGETVTTNLKARIITGEELAAITVAAGAAEGTDAFNWSLANGGYYAFSNNGIIIGTHTYVDGETESTVLSWLVENTNDWSTSSSGATDNSYGESNYGYWTLSPRADFSSHVWFVGSDGWAGEYYIDWCHDYMGCGVRPVITIPKSVLE